MQNLNFRKIPLHICGKNVYLTYKLCRKLPYKKCVCHKFISNNVYQVVLYFNLLWVLVDGNLLWVLVEVKITVYRNYT